MRTRQLRPGSTAAQVCRQQAEDLARRFAAYCESGAPDVLGEIYRVAAPLLERVAWRITADHLAAQDAVQETFLDILRQPHRFDPTRAVWPWLIAIATNKARLIRRRNRSWRSRARQHDGLAAPANDAVEELDASTWLWGTVAGLPEQQGAAVCMRYREGRSDAQVAALLDVPVSTVKSRLRTARAVLRRRVTCGQ